MTDLEMTKLCAEAMGYHTLVSNKWPLMVWPSADSQAGFIYNPLHDDAQVMALIRWLVGYNENEKLEISNHVVLYAKRGFTYTQFGDFSGSDNHLNRAIVECVAKARRSSTTEAK
jgi:hypothetical protein